VTAHRAASLDLPLWEFARRIEFTHHILKNLMEDFLRYELLLCLGEETCMFCRDPSAVQKWRQNIIFWREFMLSDQNSIQIFPDIISDLRSFQTVKRVEIVTVLMCMQNFNFEGMKAHRDQDGGRILLGVINADGGAVMAAADQVPVRM
jgi:hypothetical protein